MENPDLETPGHGIPGMQMNDFFFKIILKVLFSLIPWNVVFPNYGPFLKNASLCKIYLEKLYNAMTV